jgi:hypothetical protein
MSRIVGRSLFAIGPVSRGRRSRDGRNGGSSPGMSGVRYGILFQKLYRSETEWFQMNVEVS